MHVVNVARNDFVESKNTVMRFIVIRFFSFLRRISFLMGVWCDNVEEKSKKKAKEDTVYCMQTHRM